MDEFYDQVGWQATCSNPDHLGCVKTMNFRKHGGQVQVEKMLMYWCLAGRDIDTKFNHVRVPFPEPLLRHDTLESVGSVKDMLLQSGAEGVVESLSKRPRMQ